MYDTETKLKFKKRVRSNPKTGCWDWIGPRHPSGYGMFCAGGKRIYAHRYLYELANGPITPGMELDHLCGRKCCCKPSHLEEVTHRENMQRAAARGAWNGIRNGNAKLTEPEVLAIQLLYTAMCIPPTIIARAMGLGKSNVCTITRREGWKNLELDMDALWEEYESRKQRR